MKQVGRGRQKLPRPVLTNVQVEWLRNNLRLYTNPDLARKLNIKKHHLAELLKQLGLRKANTKPSILTDEQRQYIHDNYQQYTNKYISSIIGVKKYIVDRYCTEHNLRKHNSVGRTVAPKVINFARESQPLKRPPAVYSNVSREQHIERYLNL